MIASDLSSSVSLSRSNIWNIFWVYAEELLEKKKSYDAWEHRVPTESLTQWKTDQLYHIFLFFPIKAKIALDKIQQAQKILLKRIKIGEAKTGLEHYSTETKDNQQGF